MDWKIMTQQLPSDGAVTSPVMIPRRFRSNSCVRMLFKLPCGFPALHFWWAPGCDTNWASLSVIYNHREKKTCLGKLLKKGGWSSTLTLLCRSQKSPVQEDAAQQDNAPPVCQLHGVGAKRPKMNRLLFCLESKIKWHWQLGCALTDRKPFRI